MPLQIAIAVLLMYAGFGHCIDDYVECILVEEAGCKAHFVEAMNESTNAFRECPELYKKAVRCFEDSVDNVCSKVEDEDHHNVSLGSEEEFCKYGLLRTMENQLVNCSKGNYTECEDEFRKMFQDHFRENSTKSQDLCRTYAKSRICQANLAYGCLEINEDNSYFFDNLFVNPYCTEDRERIDDTVDRIAVGEEGSNSATYITVAVVIILLVVILTVTFFLLQRRDRNRAEIRRKKASMRSTNAAQNGQQEQTEQQEMQPLGGAVVTSNDEVSSA